MEGPCYEIGENVKTEKDNSIGNYLIKTFSSYVKPQSPPKFRFLIMIESEYWNFFNDPFNLFYCIHIMCHVTERHVRKLFTVYMYISDNQKVITTPYDLSYFIHHTTKCILTNFYGQRRGESPEIFQRLNKMKNGR